MFDHDRGATPPPLTPLTPIELDPRPAGRPDPASIATPPATIGQPGATVVEVGVARPR